MLTKKEFNHTAIMKKTGEVLKPAWTETYYYWYGQEIAQYDPRDGVLYLKTSRIYRDFNMKDYDRALKGEFHDAYKALFDELGITRESKLSEYCYA